MKSILFITTDDYPVFGTTSNLINKLIFDGEISNRFRIGVLTLQNGRTQKTVEKYKGVNIYRVPSYGNIHEKDYYTLFKSLDIQNKIGSFIEKSIIQIYEWINPGPLIYRFYNVNALIKGLEHLANKKYDIVVPISGNYDSLVAVLKSNIKAEKIFWQVDPCSTNLTRLDRERDRILRIEKEFVSSFDMVLTENIYYKELLRMYPDNGNIYQFEFPLVNERYNGIYNIEFENDSINCVFAGLIYAGIRNPDYTLRLFREVLRDNKVKLHMVGVEKKELSELYKDVPICYGKVDMIKADTMVDSADFLVNIGNKMNNQIPSKLFEYISTGKPIINICKNRDCPSLELLSNYPYVLNLFEEDNIFEEQTLMLADFLKKYRNKRIDFSCIKDLYIDYTPRYCSEKFVEYINRLEINK